MTCRWRRALALAVVVPLVAAVLAVAPLGGADPARAQSSADPVWSATLTVANLAQSTGGDNRGYLSGTGGSLTTTTFSHGGASFTVSYLSFWPAGPNFLFRRISWTGTPTFASSYALCFDGVLAFTGSGTEMFGTNPLGDNTHDPIADPGWSVGDEVAVKLWEGSTCAPAVEAGVSVSPSSVSLGENGGTASFSVKLKTQPSSDVTLNLTSSDRSIVTINDAVGQVRQVTFTSSNWSTAQSVTLTGVNDDVVNSRGRRVTAIQMQVNSLDDDYFSNSSVDLVAVTVVDDDGRSVTSDAGGSPVKYLAAGCEATFLAVDGTVNGRWDDDDCFSSLSYRHESKFYWFTLPAGQGEVTLKLDGGGRDARFWLWEEWTAKNYVGTGPAGKERRVRWLRPGVYYLEVDSGTAAAGGGFKLTMKALGAGPSGQNCLDTAWTFTGTANVQGRWDSGCASDAGLYQREYDLVLAERQVVTVEARSSDATPNLRLSTGTPAVLVEQNDGAEGVSRISRTLDAGSYDLDAVSAQAGQAGTFTLNVTVEPPPPVKSCAETWRTLVDDRTVSGLWDEGCTDGQAPPTYQRYYDLLVRDRGQVTVTVDSADADPVLSLSSISYDSAGAASLTAVASNDDFNRSTTRSRIARTLAPGRYRVTASTKLAEAAGGFALTVDGLGASSALSCGDTFESFSGEHTIEGSWDYGCELPRDPDRQPTYQRYYDMVVGRYGTWTVALSSGDADPVLTLHRVEADGSHTWVAANDDDGDSTTRSRIARPLHAGTYRITAATKNPEATGAFTLEATEGTTVYGQWDSADDVLSLPVDVSGTVEMKIESQGGYSTDLHFDLANGTTASSVRYVADPPSQRSDRDASLTAIRVPSGAHTIRAMLSPYQLNARGFYKPIVSRQIWSAALTVGTPTSGSVGYFSNLGGSLSPATFSHGGGLLRMVQVRYFLEGQATQGLRTQFSWVGNRVFARAYALCFDGVLALTGSPSEVFGTSGSIQIHSDITPSWSVGDTVAVKLYEGSTCGEQEVAVAYPVSFTVNYKSVNNALWRARSGSVVDMADSAPRVADKSAFTSHDAVVGEPFSLVLPEADAGSGNGGPYEYLLWKRGAGALFGENGLSFDAATRTVSGTPVAEGTHLLAYQVHDGDRNRARSDSFVEETDLQIVVAAAGVEGEEGPQQTEAPNRAPTFDPGVVTALSVPENSPEGTGVGAPVAATDPDEGDTIAYSLSGDDAASFAIDDDGQITTIAGVVYDYEVESYRFEPWYSLTVTADDGRGGSASIDVTVRLTDVDDAPAVPHAPEFHEGRSATREVAEGSPAGTRVGEPVTAYDLNGDKLYYIDLDGADNTAFALDEATGQLTTIAGVTYDRDAKASYNFYVVVADADYWAGELALLSSIRVTVNLTEADDTPDDTADDTEDETADDTSDDTPDAPDTAPTVTETVNSRKLKTHYAEAGKAFSVVLPEADADSGNGGPYAYEVLNRADSTAFGANGLSFDAATRTLSGTPVAEGTHNLAYRVHDSDDNRADADAFIDNTSLKIVVLAGSGNAVGEVDEPDTEPEQPNRAPAFAASTAVREVAENSGGGVNVGSPVTAADPDTGDTIAYSLSGTDASSFEIGASTGQITTRSGETYDYEAKKSYAVTVEASDGTLTATIAVTVNLTDVGTAATACTTILGPLTATAEYAGTWDNADCTAHHQAGRARYFQFTLTAQTEVAISLTAGQIYLSKDTPRNGWGSVPGPGYDHRKSVRKNNGKLVHDGPDATTAHNDGNTVTLTLPAGTYTAEAAGSTGAFTLNITPN